MTKYISTIFTSIYILLIAVVPVSCNSSSNNEENGEQSESNSKIVTVEVVNPELRSFTAEIIVVGTAMPNQKVMLHAMEGGYVQQIKKDIGDKVSKGEVIAVLENPELLRNAERLEAQVSMAEKAYNRLMGVYEKTPSLTPIQMVEETEANYLSAKAELKAAKDRIGFLQVRAPFSGIISQRFVDNGALVQSGTANPNASAVVEIMDISTIRLTIPFPEADVNALKKGMNVNIDFPELAQEPFEAKISRMAKALDPASATMQVEIDIKNASGKIKSGMYAKAVLQISSRKDVFSLPNSAQYIYQDEFFIMTVVGGKVKRLPLKKGLANKDFFEVLNAEIDNESLIITQGKNLVKDAQTVEPILKTLSNE